MSIKGEIKKAEGSVQAAYGKMTNQPEHELKGNAKKVQGSAQNVADAVKDELD